MGFSQELSVGAVLDELPMELVHRCSGGDVLFRYGGVGCDDDALGAAMFVELSGGCRLSIRGLARSTERARRPRDVSVFIVAADGPLRHLWGPPVRLAMITPASLLPWLRRTSGEGAAPRATLLSEVAGHHQERVVATTLPLCAETPTGEQLLIVEDRSEEPLSPVIPPCVAGRDLALSRHRLRNHITSLLGAIRLQRAEESEGAALRSLDRVLGRVQALHRVHAVLDDDGDEATPIELSAKVRALVEAQVALYPLRVRLTMQLAAVEVPRRDARVIVQVLAELVCNALTHGFAGRAEGSLRVVLRAEEEGVGMTVHDDGQGWRGDAPEARLGLALVRRVLRERGGALRLERDGGVAARVTLPREARHA